MPRRRRSEQPAPTYRLGQCLGQSLHGFPTDADLRGSRLRVGLLGRPLLHLLGLPRLVVGRPHVHGGRVLLLRLLGWPLPQGGGPLGQVQPSGRGLRPQRLLAHLMGTPRAPSAAYACPPW